jgi:hypothetical protein
LIASINEKSGKMEYSLRVTFEPEEKKDDPAYEMNPEQKTVLSILDEVYSKTAKHVNTKKKVLKLHYFDINIPQATIKPFVYRYKDEVSLEPILTQPASVYMKAFKVSDTFKTRFEGLDGEIIPWEDLENADFDIIPVIKFRRLFVGSTNNSIQHQLVSGIVLNITAHVQESGQKETLEKYVQEHPEEVENYLEQIKKIRQRNVSLQRTLNEPDNKPPESENVNEESEKKDNDPDGISKPDDFGKDIKKITSRAPKRK